MPLLRCWGWRLGRGDGEMGRLIQLCSAFVDGSSRALIYRGIDRSDVGDVRVLFQR